MILHPRMWSLFDRSSRRSPNPAIQPPTTNHRSGAGDPSCTARNHSSAVCLFAEGTLISKAQLKLTSWKSWRARADFGTSTRVAFKMSPVFAVAVGTLVDFDRPTVGILEYHPASPGPILVLDQHRRTQCDQRLGSAIQGLDIEPGKDAST